MSGGRDAIWFWQDSRLALLTEFQSLDVQRGAREGLDNFMQLGPVIEHIWRVRDLALEINKMSLDNVIHRFLNRPKPAVRTWGELHQLTSPTNFNAAATIAERSYAVLFKQKEDLQGKMHLDRAFGTGSYTGFRYNNPMLKVCIYIYKSHNNGNHRKYSHLVSLLLSWGMVYKFKSKLNLSVILQWYSHCNYSVICYCARYLCVRLMMYLLFHRALLLGEHPLLLVNIHYNSMPDYWQYLMKYHSTNCRSYVFKWPFCALPFCWHLHWFDAPCT